jgi:hypothetical protein
MGKAHFAQPCGSQPASADPVPHQRILHLKMPLPHASPELAPIAQLPAGDVLLPALRFLL